MRPLFLVLFATIIFSATWACFAHNGQKPTSLCALERKVSPGEHASVTVSGIYTVGPENSRLDDPACPVVPYGSTWVDLELASRRNQKKLSQLLNKTGRAFVVFGGEFYGSPLPDPRLPQTLQEGFPPHWGHLNCCLTRLVVHEIREVTAAPAEKP
jgi:hypothetical protein